ncbi:MAG: chemotaxis protein CheA [Methylophilaceae bacterium]|nr:chemotaxis protein CheA [Methylophilaceae bacterium]
MTIDMSQFYQVFFEESAEHLANMERMLLDLDVDAPNVDDLNAIFRAAHSIKGGSGTFGFTDMTEVTHVLESLLDKLRKGEMAPRNDMIDAFLEATDVLKEQLNAHINGTEADKGPAEAIIEKLRALASGEVPDAPAPQQVVEPSARPVAPAAPEIASTETNPSADTAKPHTFHITLAATPDLLKQPNRIEGLVGELEQLGQLEILSAPEPAKDKKGKDKKKKKKQGDMQPLQWKFRLTGTTEEETIRDIFAFIATPEQVVIEHEPAAVASETPSQEDDTGYGFFDTPPTPAAEEDGYGFFGPLPEPVPAAEIDQGYGFFSDPPATPAPAADDHAGYGFFTEIATPAPIQAAPPPPPKPAEPPRKTVEKPAAASPESTSIRVSVEKVDQLINLVGELVITQAMLAQTASKVDPVLYEELINSMAQLERNTRDLQEAVMSIRMMPISFVFSRFPRVVRDLASKLDKQVELVTVGENTELDKGLIEKIADPLTHLVRNSLDHGIEPPDKRVAAGKPAKGTITLSASHQGGNIVIEVADDGAGLNREKILAKAMERGIPVSDNLTDQQVWQLIFAPGFSTAETVTDVSGRGVGMDVVMRNVTEMGGSVEIESVFGVGTKITVRLPLTLAILDGMTVAVGDNIYVIPLNLIVETLQPQAEDIKSVTGRGKVVHVRGEYLPLIALHEIFRCEPLYTDPTEGVLVLIEDKGKKAALFIDTLVGQQQVVIKSLETNYRKVPGISGATIMGDGKVALILDIPALIKMSVS